MDNHFYASFMKCCGGDYTYRYICLPAAWLQGSGEGQNVSHGGGNNGGAHLPHLLPALFGVIKYCLFYFSKMELHKRKLGGRRLFWQAACISWKKQDWERRDERRGTEKRGEEEEKKKESWCAYWRGPSRSSSPWQRSFASRGWTAPWLSERETQREGFSCQPAWQKAWGVEGGGGGAESIW